MAVRSSVRSPVAVAPSWNCWARTWLYVPVSTLYKIRNSQLCSPSEGDNISAGELLIRHLGLRTGSGVSLEACGGKEKTTDDR